ncbi:TetR/AcrR family transcriptional regulator [Paenibacillus sp. MMS20-IR301]|uniref:TetR/AcrR family transcriptional regulator n=1 Tax=Paenibacillus sp. MMS20-IR301 TaxID=2895946 RepID=UPI0028E50B7B|nr:TetR/AcrR family transcriptional regulator [Paenibacillus sp. MMS20-IR301]WNS45654.1 TetR/AcrR family transcriptional regulator [Paenibacillus sp. MMS20-IR301]
MSKANTETITPSVKESADPYVQRILEAARQLFTESGLEAVSMHRIAKRAGIGQGSLYRRYTDKGEICSALLLDSTERFLSGMEQQLAAGTGGSSSLARLQSSIEQVVDFIEQYAELLNMIKSEFTGKKQLTQFEHPFFQRLGLIMAELLQRASAGGEIIGIDPRFAATALISVLSPDLYLYEQKRHGSSKQDISRGIVTLFVTGLAGR